MSKPPTFPNKAKYLIRWGVGGKKKNNPPKSIPLKKSKIIPEHTEKATKITMNSDFFN